jgi:hypothetical protein
METKQTVQRTNETKSVLWKDKQDRQTRSQHEEMEDGRHPN